MNSLYSTYTENQAIANDTTTSRAMSDASSMRASYGDATREPPAPRPAYPDRMSDRSLVVKVTCGAEAAERCNQGFTVAATAVAAGVRVSLWLTGDATWTAVTGREPDLDLPFATPLSELLDLVLAEGTVTVCGQCAARRSITEPDLRPGVRIAGSVVFVEECLAPAAQALVY